MKHAGNAFKYLSLLLMLLLFPCLLPLHLETSLNELVNGC